MNAFDSDNFQIVEQEVLNTGDQWVLKSTNFWTEYTLSNYTFF